MDTLEFFELCRTHNWDYVYCTGLDDYLVGFNESNIMIMYYDDFNPVYRDIYNAWYCYKFNNTDNMPHFSDFV